MMLSALPPHLSALPPQVRNSASAAAPPLGVRGCGAETVRMTIWLSKVRKSAPSVEGQP